MITPADDYPLHQTAEPMAFAGTDRNFYDRFFFNGYNDDIFFAVALGVYPQLNIMDGAFCVSSGGTQHNLRFSKEMGLDRLDLQLAGLRVEIIKPLEETLIKLEDEEQNIHATLCARACHAAVGEPRFTRRQGARAFMDYTRLTQNVAWQGEIALKGKNIKVDNCLGTRDRSWGVRPIGAPDGNPLLPPLPPQFYWLWMPTHFERFDLFCHTNDDGEGEPWNRRAVLSDRQSGTTTHFDNVALEVSYQDNRRVASATLKLTPDISATFKPKGRTFYMNGLGYTHPTWGHGTYHGQKAEAYDEIDLSEAEDALTQGAFHNLHIQAQSEVALHYQGDTFQGAGAIEQLFVGAHKPSGWA